jgi:uncharacterized protein (DUF2062 family)
MTFNPVVVAPTYNNAGTLAGVLRRLDAQGVPVLVVNDGSTDGTAAVLADWLARPRDHQAEVRTHPRNRGKAMALRTGFAAAAELGYTHALTIDTDGQLAPEQVPDFLAAARANPAALVLGTRDASAADYPGKSKLGRRVSNLLVWMECGRRVSDSQCGLRVYPLATAERLACRSGRYGFETEVIVRAGWAGWPVVEVPAACTYFAAADRVTHFQPWRDSLRAVGMHARLVARALVPIGRLNGPRGRQVATAGGDGPPQAVQRAGEAAGTLNYRAAGDDEGQSVWRRFLHWVSPREAWRQVTQDRPEGTQRTAMAMGLAIGAFIGCVPAYGLHSVAALYAARRLNLNPLGVVLGTQVACPPLGVALAVAASAIGSLALRGGIPPLSDFAPLWQGWDGLLKIGPWFFLNWLVGSVVVGAACMAVVFFLADHLLRRLPSIDPDAPGGEPRAA